MTASHFTLGALSTPGTSSVTGDPVSKPLKTEGDGD
jgi:hypothetical protein